MKSWTLCLIILAVVCVALANADTGSKPADGHSNDDKTGDAAKHGGDHAVPADPSAEHGDGGHDSHEPVPEHHDEPTAEHNDHESKEDEEEGSGDHKPKHGHWSHDDIAHWQTDYPLCTADSPRQSPIDIKPRQAVFDENLPPITLYAHKSNGSTDKLHLVNNGHAVDASLGYDIYISGGGLGDVYKVAGFHFHWGRDDSTGSEHTVGGHHYPLEMHIVTYDTEHHSTLGSAVTGDNSLAVLGVLFEVSERDNPIFNKVFDHLSEINNPGHQVDLEYIDLNVLLPHATHKYYRYLGSLTTPPCAESVIWTIFSHTIEISEAQMALFRKMSTAHAEGFDEPSPLVDNFRPTMPMHGRKVYRSYSLSRPVRPAVDDNKSASLGEVNSAVAAVRGTTAMVLAGLLLASKVFL